MPSKEPLMGLVADLPDKDYHAASGVSKSSLDVLRRSPFHYWSVFFSGTAPARKETQSMREGTVIHAAVLEPERYASDFLVAPCKDRRSKVWTEFSAECEVNGKTPITPSEDELAQRCGDSVRSNPIASEILNQKGYAEMSAFANDEVTGQLMRSRFDWLGNGFIMDLKTSMDASPYGVKKSTRSFRYQVQAAMYSELSRLCGEEVDFIFCFVERSHPFCCGMYELDKASMEAGRTEWRRLMDLYHECITKYGTETQWPGYTGADIQKISI